MLIFIYSGFFNPDTNNYPVKCTHEIITGKPCPSCGLSRGFSSILRSDLEKAAVYNPYSLRVFLFFAFQLLLRISNMVLLQRKPDFTRQLIIFDSLISVLAFILSFRQFFSYYFELWF